MAAAPSSELLFQHPRATSGALVFGGDDDTTGPVAAVTVNAAFVLGGVHVRATVSAPVRVLVAATLGGVNISAAVVYDNRVTRWLDQRAAAPHQTARSMQPQWSGGWGTPARERRGTHLPWGRAHRLATQPTLPLQPAIPLRQTRAAPWPLGTRMQQSSSAVHQAALSLRLQKTAAWQTAQGLDRSTASRMQSGIFYDHGHTTHWQPATAHAPTWRAPVGASLHLVGKQWAVMPWHTAQQAPPGLSVLPPTEPPFDPCYLPDARLVFDVPWSADARLVFVCERHGPGPNPEPEAEIVIPVRRYYVVINDITLRRVDGNYELLAYGLSMSIDRDSWTWSFSATLRADALPYLEPGSRTEPVELEATINGAPYRLQVEKIGRDTKFGAVRIRISGRGRAAILAAPYAPVLNFGNSAPRTAQQLMGDVLTINGVSIGWDVDWGLVDWPVPAGAWAMQGSYIDAITDIAAAAGGYVQPHATDATLRILPSYPVAPWEWSTVTPDVELPMESALVESVEWVDRPMYDRVFLSGISKGVFGPFTRSGTAGGLIAPQVSHALMTHADVHRQRGLAELSNTGRQAHYQIKTQVTPEAGIIVPGKFVRRVGGTTVIGIVRSNRLDWSSPVMRQTIGLETHVAA